MIVYHVKNCISESILNTLNFEGLQYKYANY